MVAARVFFEHSQILWKVYKKKEINVEQIRLKLALQPTLHKKRSFSFRIFSVSVTKSQENADLVTFTEQIFNGNFIFCVVQKLIELITKDYLVAWLLLTGAIFVNNFSRKLQISRHYVYKFYWSFTALTLKVVSAT